MLQLRTAVKLTFALLAVWLGLVWAGLLPRPAFLPPDLDIEPLTFLLGTFAALLLGFWKNNDAKSEAVTISHRLTEPDESLQTEIRKYLKSRYEHRIRQKLAGREPVNLRKIPSSTGTSEEGAQNFITLPAEKVPSGMAELFEEARGRLLVVGAPGAGKTTLLLQLALALLERPGKDLPVLLNLATWRSEFATFDDWLQRILPLELGASKALAEKIRRNTPLILLLDGLDEVPEDARASCLKAIGEYGSEASRRFVISSRIAEYAATQDAPVYLEVEVQPLTPQQVIDNLTAYVFQQPEAKPLLNALQTDPLLREAIANPFYLNTAQLLFATGRKYSDFDFSPNTDVAGRQRELVERFVKDALGRKVKRDYSKEKARKWLGFLAGKMEESGSSMFELVNMQPWWIKTTWQYELLCFSLLLPTVVLLPGFSINLILFLLVPSQFSVESIIVLISSIVILCPTLTAIQILVRNIDGDDAIISNSIRTSESRSWSWGNFYQSLNQSLMIFRVVMLSFFCIMMVFVLLIRIVIDYEYVHAKEFLITLAAITLISILAGLFVSFFALIMAGIIGNWHTTNFFLLSKNPYHRFASSLKNFNLSLLYHLALRLTLAFERVLPLRLVTFLNEMSLRHLLEFDGDPMTGKGGGSWRWRHRIIQEYFLEAPASAKASAGKRDEK